MQLFILPLDWRSEPDLKKAAQIFKSKILSENENKKALMLRMDLGNSPEDQERSLISFYKAPKTEWPNPLTCRLEDIAGVPAGAQLPSVGGVCSNNFGAPPPQINK